MKPSQLQLWCGADHGVCHIGLVKIAVDDDRRTEIGFQATPSKVRQLAAALIEVADEAEAQMPKIDAS